MHWLTKWWVLLGVSEVSVKRISIKFWTTSKFILKQLDYSPSISMRDSWLGLPHGQLSRDRNLELIIWLFNRNTCESLGELEKTFLVLPSFHECFYWTISLLARDFLSRDSWRETNVLCLFESAIIWWGVRPLQRYESKVLRHGLHNFSSWSFVICSSLLHPSSFMVYYYLFNVCLS